jgi:hypothetical protein
MLNGYPDFRALTTFQSLDPQHKTFLVREDGSAPHLFVGEYAVIDTTDRELQHGELYIVHSQSGERHRRIVQAASSCRIVSAGVEILNLIVGSRIAIGLGGGPAPRFLPRR